MLLATRLHVSWQFLKSGWLKLTDWETTLFLFQEGNDPGVRRLFQQMAKLSGGAWAHFDQNSARELSVLLGAVARYAAAGRQGLLDYGNGSDSSVKLLLEQLK